jgi:hypothetical protein
MMQEELPSLENTERLELEVIMLRMALEQEKVEKYEKLILDSKKSFAQYQQKLESWNKVYNEKLKLLGLDISQVGIEADTGRVYKMSKE